MDDHQIVDLFFNRREAAIGEASNKYGGRMLLTAMNILQSRQDAEECLNDALLKAWESIPPVRPMILGAFLVKISRNLAINKYRSKSAAKRGGGETSIMLSELEDCIRAGNGTEPEKAYEAAQLTAAINTFLASMNQTARVAFVLRYFYGESIAGICERFEMSESKIKSLLFRTRKKLAEYLKKQDINV